jgi:hypothetical protein
MSKERSLLIQDVTQAESAGIVLYTLMQTMHVLLYECVLIVILPGE